MVPADDARAIHAGRQSERVSLLLLPGGHDDCSELDSVMSEVIEFLNRALAPVSTRMCRLWLHIRMSLTLPERGSSRPDNEDQPMSQETLWSTRYRDAGEDYLFGTEPNRFLAHRATLLESGRSALSVADGEGRNSVWLAEQGLDVTAIEISAVAVEKARRLAAGRRWTMRFMQVDMLAPGWPPAELHDSFDWVVGIFIQFVRAGMA